jgi:hypothetical protein
VQSASSPVAGYVIADSENSCGVQAAGHISRPSIVTT